MTISLLETGGAARAFELINKTNQFNLNGRRLSESEFQAAMSRQGAVCLLVSYKDKYGLLGKISVVLGQVANSTLKINSWVLSCRAFSRHIEYQCLAHLFAAWDISEIEFDYQPTPRNEPVREFLRSLLGAQMSPPYQISRQDFMNNKPALHHQVNKADHV